MKNSSDGQSRRQFLGAFGGGLGLTEVRSELRVHQTTSDGLTRRGLATDSSLSHPANVIDSFLNISAATPYLMGRSGWDDVPTHEKIDTLRRFHAEKLDLHTNFGGSGTPPTAIAGGPTTVLGHFSEDIALPAAGQQLLNVQLDQFNFWYNQIPESERWAAPNGSVIESASDFAARNFDGSPRIDERYNAAPPTLFFDQYQKHLTDAAVTYPSHGYTEVYLDNSNFPTSQGLDFSVWARRAFQTHLESLSPERLDELGITDPESFDVKSYLQDENLAPGEVSTPFEDPVAREFKRFQFIAHRNYIAEYRQQIRDSFPERSGNNGIAVVGNLGMDRPRPSSIMLGDTVDVVSAESEQTVPPKKVLDWKYKLQRAAGRSERPVVSVGSILSNGSVSTAEGLDPSKEYPTLLNLEVAEGFANGGMRSISLAGWGMSKDNAIDNWIRTDGSVNERLQEFLDFVWANKRFLQGMTSEHDVAVVYSLPSVMWQRAPEWDKRNSSHRRAFQGSATLLREYQLPYDVRIFGLADVWDDADQLEQLTEYRTILLPNIVAVSDQQASAIKSVLDSGTHVVATGGPPDRSADWQSRDDIATLLNNHNNATLLDDTPGLSVYNTGSSNINLRPALVKNGEQLQVSAPDIGVTIRQRPNDGISAVHFVNYAYDPNLDEVPTQQNVDVSVSIPGTDPKAARWLTPIGSTRVEIESDDNGLTVTLPKLDIYGVLVFGTDSSSLTEGKRNSAHDAILQAEDTVKPAQDDGRTHLGLTRARAELENARIAKEHKSYALAKTAANRAESEAKSAIAPPVIGIDQAHGQSTGDFDWGMFKKLRRRFTRYEYREIAKWSKETLSELDLLIIPPAQRDSYGFTSAERKHLHTFIEEGGRVVVLGHPEMAADIASLTDRYGLGFEGNPIIQLEPVFSRGADESVDPRQFDARTIPSTLTQYSVSFRTINATPVTTTEEAVEEFGFVHEWSSAFVNRSGPEDERTGDDVSAQGMPLVAARFVGDGYIAAVGTAEHFAEPTQGEDGGRGGPQDDPLVTAMLRTATTAKGDVNTGSTAAETLNANTTESPTETSSGSVTGFTLIQAFAAVGGVAALCKWLFGDDS